MAQAIAHRFEAIDGRFDLLGLGKQLVADDLRLSIRREHSRDFIKREPSRPTKLNEGETVMDTRIKQAPQATPPRRPDKTARLVISKGRCWHARPTGDFRNIGIFHGLT